MLDNPVFRGFLLLLGPEAHLSQALAFARGSGSQGDLYYGICTDICNMYIYIYIFLYNIYIYIWGAYRKYTSVYTHVLYLQLAYVGSYIYIYIFVTYIHRLYP